MVKIDTKKKLHKKRNQKLNMAETKSKRVDKAFGLDTDEAKRAVAVKYTIDVNKRQGLNDEPKMTK